MAQPTLLRPLGVGEILDAAMRVYARHWRRLMLCAAVIALPVLAIRAGALAAAAPDQLRFDAGADQPLDQLQAGQLASAGVVAILFLALFAALSGYIAGAWTGGTPDLRASLRAGLPRLPAMLVLAVLTGAALGLAFLAFLVPGIWLGVAWCLAQPVAVFERANPVQALGRSFALVRGRWWGVFGLLIVTSFLVSLVDTIVQVTLLGVAERLLDDSVAVDAVASVVAGTLSFSLTIPFMAVVLTILYFDQRLRHEGVEFAPEPGFEPEPEPDPERERAWGAPAGWSAPRPPRSPGGAPEPAPEPGRGDWQPPEPPRGPGGL